MKTADYSYVACSTENDSDIVFIEFPGNLKVDIVAAKKIVAGRLDFTENKKHYLIADLSNVKHVSSEAKAFMQRPDAGLKNILGCAFIASNPVSAMIANIFIKTPKNFTAKFFSNKQSAFEWILEYKQKINDTNL